MHGLIDILLNGHVLINIIFILLDIILLIFHKKFSNKVLIIINIIPIAIGIIHFILFNFKGNISASLRYFDTLYLSAFLFILILIFVKRKPIYKMFLILFLSIFCIDLFLTGVTITRYYTIHNYTYYSYTNSFKKMVNTLKKEYVLKMKTIKKLQK